MSGRPEFEYKVSPGAFYDDKQAERYLNKLGSEGWQMVGATVNRFIFCRQVDGEQIQTPEEIEEGLFGTDPKAEKYLAEPATTDGSERVYTPKSGSAMEELARIGQEQLQSSPHLSAICHSGRA